MSEESISYEGYRITANSTEVPESNTWSVILTISRGPGDDEDAWIISAGDVYESKEKALEHCFDFGRQLIDREMKGCCRDR